MVPNGWKKKPLKDLCKMQAGKFVKASQILPKAEENTYPCFGGNGLRGYAKSFTHSGTYSLIGRQGALCGNITLAEGKFHATEHAVVTHPNSDVDVIWLYYVLNDLNLNQYATGQAQPGLSVKNLDNVYTLAPESASEQRKIAKILSTWDKAISTTESLIDNSKQQKKALMQQLLSGKKRLLDDSGKPFESEWEEIKLGDVCSKVTDGAHHSPQSVEHGYPMFSVKDMRPTGFAKNTARHISEDDFKSLEKQNCKPEVNDILIAKDGSILKYCFVVTKEIQGVILSSIALLRPKLNKIYPHFIAQYFSQESVRFFVGKALTSGSGVPRIILKDFKGIHLRIPSLLEQQKISAALANADQEIELLEKQLADLKQEKKALMQQLLTGKRRVTLN